MFEILSIFNPCSRGCSYLLVNFVEPITTILVTAFLTDLRKAASASAHEQSLSTMASLEFRIMGSIGASLPHDDCDISDGRASEEARDDVMELRGG
ncbi:hypothetical protein ONZ51_g3677 [Trametes cubensis]|uniref:Uncharacterized protein n=1 Tax=Trametes cubensis TaxID=1111947 RepID=A0AAD7XDP9_9APHY|nr:hypothetical protein ONZ51_g3677 [Trametes cubensis]